MKRIHKPALRNLCLAAAGVLLLTAGSVGDFSLGRNLEQLHNLFRDLSLFYVDEVDPDELLQHAAQGMVSALDPYTEFLPESEMNRFELLTTGKYAGIGALIRQKGEGVAIAQPYRGFPADRAGLRIGDRIVAIDGVDARTFSTEQVSSRLKGDPGTRVRVRVRRLVGDAEEEVEIERERIALSGIPYSGYVAEGIGYIAHSEFTEGCSEDLRAALVALREQGDLRGLILDYRGNGGGILQEAVKILSLFVPKGTTVVSMRGRQTEYDETFTTPHEPLAPDLPLVVLTDRSTASAAEIVAGALQDLDRAVVLGRRTYGKGLVQSPRPLGYNAYVKLTTAKYYIPSGRCIQAVDYAHRNEDGSVGYVPDSLIREFRTAAGRRVYDGGGIMPDSVTEARYNSRFAMVVYARGFIDDFTDDYVRTHDAELRGLDPAAFRLPDGAYDAFVDFMKRDSFAYESQTRRTLKALKEAAAAERLDNRLAPSIEALEAALDDGTEANLDRYREEIEELLSRELVLRYAYADGVSRYALRTDEDVAAALALLGDGDRCRGILLHRDTDRK